MITPSDIQSAERTLAAYQKGRQALERRIVENEKWYRLRHWEVIGASPSDPRPASGWLFNVLANKHADAMDNYPMAQVLPREAMDAEDARALSGVLPAVLEQNEFEQAYSDMWWYKLKSGTGAFGVFWDGEKLGGLGDISIRALDVLNLYWEPGVRDLQRSRNVFHVELVNRDELRERWPGLDLSRAEGVAGFTPATYAYDDAADASGKALVVDWYYKRPARGRTVVHYAKLCGGQLLYASENDPRYAQRGYYDHGKYPFVLDVLFPVQGSPAGFGYLDVCKSPQLYIDKLDQALLKNTVIGARPRFWVRGDGCVNEEEYADLSRDFVHFTGSGNPAESVFPIQAPAFNSYAVTMRGLKVEEMKEVTGNREFSQGGSAGGVTAASAIAALQEAGSKLSRDMIKASYRAFVQVAYLCIDLMRQFYEEPRTFRILGPDGAVRYAAFCGQSIAGGPVGDDFLCATRVPVFDIRVVAQKNSPFSTVAQNERAKELFGMGFFRPEMADQALLALDMMQFDGIDAVKEKISRGGSLAARMGQIVSLMREMAARLDAACGTGYAGRVEEVVGPAGGGLGPAGGTLGPAGGGLGGGGLPVRSAMRHEEETNPLGEAFAAGKRGLAGEARKQAAKMATPK